MTFPTGRSTSFIMPIFHTDCKSDGAGQVPQALRQRFVCREFYEDCGWINTCERMKAAVRHSEKLGVSTVMSGPQQDLQGPGGLSYPHQGRGGWAFMHSDPPFGGR